MAYRVDVTERAARDLGRIYSAINARDSAQARTWFNGLEKAILSLDELPERGAIVPTNSKLRHLLYGGRRNLYWIIYAIDVGDEVVTVLHVRHGARNVFNPDNDDEKR